MLACGVILFAMVLISGSHALQYDWEKAPLNLFFIGGVFFAISYLFLCGIYLGPCKERPIDLTLNYITYYAAQFLIVSTLVFIGYNESTCETEKQYGEAQIERPARQNKAQILHSVIQNIKNVEPASIGIGEKL